MGGAWRDQSGWARRIAGGGTGNPGGLGGENTSGTTNVNGNSVDLKGNDGTGGLLIIFSSTFTNNGLISSRGTDSADGVFAVSGGASGGGSVNVFYNKLKNKGEFDVSGGKSVKYGGAGGAGTATVGRIENGTFIKE